MQIFSKTVNSGAYNRAGTTYNANAYSFRVTVDLNSQDQTNNTSNVTVGFYGRGNGWSYEANGLSYDISQGYNETVTKVKSGSVKSITDGAWKLLGSYTHDYEHDAQGYLNLSFTAVFKGVSSRTFYPRTVKIATGVLPIDRILRRSDITVEPRILKENDDMQIDITRYSPTYTTTVYYEIEGTTVTLDTKGTTDQFIVTYATLVGYMGAKTQSDVLVTCETYSGDELLGTVTKEVTVMTGFLPFSLYDDLYGEIGATVGMEATKGGFNVYTDVDFSAAGDYDWFRYHDGDVIEIDEVEMFPGMLAGNNAILFNIYLPRSISNINTFTVDNMTLDVRDITGNYLPNVGFNFKNFATVETSSTNNRIIRIRLNRGSSWGGTANTPVIVKASTGETIRITCNE